MRAGRALVEENQRRSVESPLFVFKYLRLVEGLSKGEKCSPLSADAPSSRAQGHHCSEFDVSHLTRCSDGSPVDSLTYVLASHGNSVPNSFV